MLLTYTIPQQSSLSESKVFILNKSVLSNSAIDLKGLNKLAWTETKGWIYIVTYCIRCKSRAWLQT